MSREHRLHMKRFSNDEYKKLGNTVLKSMYFIIE